MMPKVSGGEFLDKLRSSPRHATTPIMMLTASENTDLEYELLAQGADDFCFKNTQRRVLLKRVERLLIKRRLRESGRGGDTVIERNPLAHMLVD